MNFYYRMDPETKEELRLLKAEAVRLNTDFETFAAGYYGMNLHDFRNWMMAGGPRPNQQEL